MSLLKHEAQHTVDMKQYPGIIPTELEYRAKLVELHYSNDYGLLQRFIEDANGSRSDDSHVMASARIRNDFEGFTAAAMEEIHAKALELLWYIIGKCQRNTLTDYLFTAKF